MKKKDLDRAARALLGAGVLNDHGDIPPPTKADLERKFVMRLNRKGKPIIKEIKSK